MGLQVLQIGGRTISMEFVHKKRDIALWIFLVAVMSRLLPHPSNFTAMQAIVLFGNRWIASSWRTWSVVLLAQFGTDMCIGFYRGIEFVYLSLILTGLCVHWVGPIRGFRYSLGWAFTSCIFFFLISNLGCWKEDVYSQDLAGLLHCYAAGLPFFFNHLLGTLFYGLGLEMLFIVKQAGQNRSSLQQAVA